MSSAVSYGDKKHSGPGTGTEVGCYNTKDSPQRPDASRYADFTDFDVKGFDATKIKGATRVTWQIEACPNSDPPGRLHIQGFVRFANSVKWSTAKRRILHGREGSPETRLLWAKEAPIKENYCRKLESRVDGPWTIGEECKQGERTELVDFRDALVRGADDYELLMDCPTEFFKYGKMLDRARAAIIKEKSRRFRRIQVSVHVGKTGVGKSRSALYGEESDIQSRDVFRVTSPGRSNNGNWEKLWWDGYNGEKTIVLDDFTGWISVEDFLALTDGHSYRGGIKGSSTYIIPDKIIINSNIQVDEWWPNISPEHIEAVERRFSDGTKFKKCHIPSKDVGFPCNVKRRR